MRVVLILVVLCGLLLWYIPSTISLFSGTHSFYNIDPVGNQVPCQKCHGEISAEIHKSGLHSNFSCSDCHRVQKDVQYASGDGTNNSTSGMMAHASSTVKCVECHSEFINNTPDVVHDAFLKYGVENDVNNDCIACHTAIAISINWTKPGAIGINTVSNGIYTSIVSTNIAYMEKVETFGNQQGDAIAVSNIAVLGGPDIPVPLIPGPTYGTPTPGPTSTPVPGDIGTPMPNPTFKFIAWGDTKGGTNVLQSESRSIVSKNLNPGFTLYAGDVCDSGPSVACFVTWKDSLNGDSTGAASNGLFDKTFAIRGNHDSSGGSVWQSEFNFNNVASSIGATNYVEQAPDMTYSFDYDNSHFVGIDNPCGNLNSCADDITSSQISWLDQDLTNAENRGLKHAFLIWHGPAYPVDGHCCGGISSAMIAVLNNHPIVSAGFFGHEHIVEYTHLNSNVIPSLSCSFEQVISGGAGAGLYGLTGGRKVDYYLGKTDGYTMVGVSGNDFDISFYKADGTRMKTLSFTETGTCQ